MGKGGTASGNCNFGSSGGWVIFPAQPLCPQGQRCNDPLDRRLGEWQLWHGPYGKRTDPLCCKSWIPWPAIPKLFFLRVLVALSRILNHRYATVGRTPGHVMSPTQRPLPGQHTKETNIHAPSGIRTHNPIKRVAVDPRRRPRGQWDQPIITCCTKLTNLILYYLSYVHFILGNPL